MLKQTRNVFLIFTSSLILFTWGLYNQEIIGFDSRFYLFAQEMLHYGLSWFPTTYAKPYPDYPANGIILIYYLAQLTGTLNKLIAVLPTAICASLTLVMTYLIGAMQSRRWGLYAVFFMLLTLTFLRSARGISLDMYPTLFTTACFYLVYAADKKQSPQLMWGVFPLLFMSFLFRGPIGLIIPTGVVCVYYLMTRNFKRFFISGVVAASILTVCTMSLLMLAQHTGGDAFFYDVLRMQIVGRIDNPYLPRDFYFINSLKMYALAYPVALLVLIGLAFSGEEAKDKKFILLLFGWMLVVLLGMTIPDDKKERYILEISPAISLMAAYVYFAPEDERYFHVLRGLLNLLFLCLPVICLLGLIYLHQYAGTKKLTFNIHFVCMFIVFGALQVANLVIVRRHQDTPAWRETLLLGSASLAFVIATIAIVEPVELYLDKTREFVVTIEAQRQEARAKLVFYKETPDGTSIKYLINMQQQEKPEFIQDQNALLHYPAPAFFVTSADYFLQLPSHVAEQFHIVAHGKLGHVQVVVFEKNKV